MVTRSSADPRRVKTRYLRVEIFMLFSRSYTRLRAPRSDTGIKQIRVRRTEYYNAPPTGGCFLLSFFFIHGPSSLLEYRRFNETLLDFEARDEFTISYINPKQFYCPEPRATQRRFILCLCLFLLYRCAKSPVDC